MKRLFSITTIFVLAITLLTACTGKKETSGGSVSMQTDSTQTAASTSATAAGKWPNNDYAKLAPQPNAGTIGSSRAKNDDYFEGISISNMTWDEAQEVESPQLFSMETYSQTAIQQFRENLKVNLEKAIDDFIDKGLTEVQILGVNVFFGGKKE